MSLLSVCCMGRRGIVFKFADFAACPACLCFSLSEINRIVHAIRFFDKKAQICLTELHHYSLAAED